MVSQLRQVWNDRCMRGQLRAILPALNRFARTLAPSRHDAEDLVQMTCEQALGRSTPSLPDDQLRSGLFQTMRTIWDSELRDRQIQDQHAKDELVSPHRASAEDGEGAAESRVMLQDLEQAILRLSENERRLLDLVCVQGRSYKEAADITGVPIGTVMSRLARARLHLMEQIKVDRSSSEGSIRTLQPCRP
jgi:RNA polymerase sigma-70 factor (ECF subfamily)